MFAAHLAHCICPDEFHEDEWPFFVGELVQSLNTSTHKDFPTGRERPRKSALVISRPHSSDWLPSYSSEIPSGSAGLVIPNAREHFRACEFALFLSASARSADSASRSSSERS